MTVSEFYEPIRKLTGDDDPEGLYDHTDESIAAAVRSVFRFGKAPAGYTLSGSEISPSVPYGEDFYRICLEAAMMLVAPAEPLNFRTRGISVTKSGHRKRDLLFFYRHELGTLSGGADNFSSSQDFLVWLHTRICDTPPPPASTPAPPAPSEIRSTATGLIGNATDLVYDITHGLNREGLSISLVLVATGEYITARVQQIDLNSMRVTFSEPPGEDSVRWTVLG